MLQPDDRQLWTCEGVEIEHADPRRYSVNLTARCVKLVFALYGIRIHTVKPSTYIIGRYGCAPYFARLVSEGHGGIPILYVVYPPGHGIGEYLIRRYNGYRIVIPWYIAVEDGISARCHRDVSRNIKGMPVAVCGNI